MGDSRDIFTYVFEALRAFQANAVPVVPLDGSPPMVASVAGIIATDHLGAAIAVRLEDLFAWHKQPNYPHKVGFREGQVLYVCDRHGKQIHSEVTK